MSSRPPLVSAPSASSVTSAPASIASSAASTASTVSTASPHGSPHARPRGLAYTDASLTRKRRMFRKPLPPLPGERGEGDEEDEWRRREAEDDRKVEAWWPDQMPDVLLDADEERLPPTGDRTRARANADQGPLDWQAERHLKALIFHSLRSADSVSSPLSQPAEPTESPSSSSAPPPNSLSPAWGPTMFDALLAALSYLSIPTSPPSSSSSPLAPSSLNDLTPLRELARTHSVAWRAELASGADGLRLGQDGELASVVPGRRQRKRDVALRLFSNAVWLARGYATAAATASASGSTARSEANKADAVDKLKRTAEEEKKSSRAPSPFPTSQRGLTPTAATISLPSLSPVTADLLPDFPQADEAHLQPSPLRSADVSRSASPSREREKDGGSVAGRSAASNALAAAAAAPAANHAGTELIKAAREVEEEKDKRADEASRVSRAWWGWRLESHDSGWEEHVGDAGAAAVNADGPLAGTSGPDVRLLRFEAGDFDGQPLFAGEGPAPVDLGRESKRVKLLGGTFVILASHREEADAVRKVLEPMFFAASALLLESHVLGDLGYVPPPRPSPPPRPQAKPAEKVVSPPSSPAPPAFSSSCSAAPAPLKHHKRWTSKSLFGMLKSGFGKDKHHGASMSKENRDGEEHGNGLSTGLSRALSLGGAVMDKLSRDPHPPQDVSPPQTPAKDLDSNWPTASSRPPAPAVSIHAHVALPPELLDSSTLDKRFLFAFIRLQSFSFLNASSIPQKGHPTTPDGSVLGNLGLQLLSRPALGRRSSAHAAAVVRASSTISNPSSVAASLSMGADVPLDWDKDTVSYFAKAGPMKDALLGQVVEQLCAHASLAAQKSDGEGAKVEPEKETGKSKGEDQDGGGSGSVHLFHADMRVSISVQSLSPRMKDALARTLAPPSPDEPLVKTPTFPSAPSPSPISHDHDCDSSKQTPGSDAADAGAGHHPATTTETLKSLLPEAIGFDRHLTLAQASTTFAMPVLPAYHDGAGGGKDGRAGIIMWRACARCGKQAKAKRMSEATYLYSFHKFLEVLMYDPSADPVPLCSCLEERGDTRLSSDTLGPAATAGASSSVDVDDRPPLMTPRPTGRRDVDQTVRLFQCGDGLVKVRVKPIVRYDMLTEGPVIFSSSHTRRAASLNEPRREPSDENRKAEEAAALLDATRLEILRFFSSLKARIAALEEFFVGRELDEMGRTVKAKVKEGDSSANGKASANGKEQGQEHKSTLPDVVGGSAISQNGPDIPLPAPSVGDLSAKREEGELVATIKAQQPSHPLQLLSNLKKAFCADEFDLYDYLKVVDAGSVNDLRLAFLDRATSAKNRLAAWKLKHLSEQDRQNVVEDPYDEPEYASSSLHTFPGSNVVVREEEPVSIVAFSLSSRDFQAELRKMDKPEPSATASEFSSSLNDKTSQVLSWRSTVASSAPSPHIPPSPFPDTASGLRSSHSMPLDPDFDSVFFDPDPVMSSVKRKKHGRDSSILSLTLRRVSSSTSSSAASATSSPAGSQVSTPHSEVDVLSFDQSHDTEDARGLDALSLAAAGASALDPAIMELGSTSNHATVSNSSHPPTHTLSKKTSDDTLGSSSSQDTFRAELPPLSGRPDSLTNIFTRETRNVSSPTTMAGMRDGQRSPERGGQSKDEPVSLAASGLNALWSLGSNLGSIRARRPESARIGDDFSSTRDGETVLDSPHIKHTFAHGTTKISCVSWFAEEFADLRKKWEVEDVFIQSLSRSSKWNASGGKSKSHFFKTNDDRFIAKSLQTIWSVDEKEAFLDFAPSYIRYMLRAAVQNEPTCLVKILGVYSVKIKDMQKGETKLKLNLMILENVFFGDEGESVRFDLKGIRERRVKNGPAEATSAVWWDGEWIDNYKSRAYVSERDKDMFGRALDNDLTFLMNSNVMDYSLLLGVDEKNKAFRLRIVDYVGAFTLAKQLEHSGKRALKAGPAKGNVTVLPPKDYAQRFRTSMECYFQAIPDTTYPPLQSRRAFEDDEESERRLPSVL